MKNTNPFALLEEDEETVLYDSQSQMLAPAAPKPKGKTASIPAKKVAPVKGQIDGFDPVVKEKESHGPAAHHHHGPKRGQSHASRGQRGGWKGKGREFDRHGDKSHHDTEKSIQRVLGEPGFAEEEGRQEAAIDAEKEAAERQLAEENERKAALEAEEARYKTLAEYMAEKKANATPVAQLPKVRKPNEGSGNKWKNSEALKKEEENYFVLPEKGKAKKSEPVQKEVKVKQHLEIEQRFSEPSTTFRGDRPSRGGKGDRPGSNEGRGSRGGRGGRGSNRSSNAAPNLNDTSLFPTLGASAK